MKTLRAVLVTCLACVVPVAAGAATILFDLESTTPTYDGSSGILFPGALTSLDLTSGGLTMTLTRPGSAFDIVANTGTDGQAGKPASFGIRSVAPFSDASDVPFLINFSIAITGFSLDFGDYGGDSDTLLLRAYSGLNGSGNLLQTVTPFLGTGGFPVFTSASVGGPNVALSVLFIGGSAAFPNSVYYDNFQVTIPDAVPEPTWPLLLGSGLVMLALRGRWRAKS